MSTAPFPTQAPISPAVAAQWAPLVDLIQRCGYELEDHKLAGQLEMSQSPFLANIDSGLTWPVPNHLFVDVVSPLTAAMSYYYSNITGYMTGAPKGGHRNGPHQQSMLLLRAAGFDCTTNAGICTIRYVMNNRQKPVNPLDLVGSSLGIGMVSQYPLESVTQKWV